MKKFLSLSLAAAMALGFAACSSEDVPQPKNEDQQKVGNGAYIEMTLTFPSATTSRAGTEYTANGAESSEKYVDGSDFENTVKKIYLFFFDADGNVKEIEGKTYKEYGVYKGTETGSTTEQLNGEASIRNGAPVYKTATYQLPSVLSLDTDYHVYALVNQLPDNVADIATEADLLNSTMAFTGKDGEATGIDTEIGIPMAARSYNGTVYATLHATTANTQSSPYELDYEIERSYGRIAFIDSKFTVPLYKSNAEAEKGEGVGATVGKAHIESYYVVNKNKKLYTYRHVGDIDANYSVVGQANWSSLPEGLFGRMTDTNPYVIDPITNLKKETALAEPDPEKPTYFLQRLDQLASPSTATDYSVFKQLKAAVDNVPQSVEYVAENTMGVNAQRKGHTTGIIFCVTIEPNKVDGLSLDENQDWRVNNNQDLYFFEGEFYSSIDKINTIKKIEATSKTMSEFGIRYFKKGMGFYEYYIRHLDNGDYTDMGKMEFAIVRNNSYELSVKSIAMSPYSSLPKDPKPDSDPEHPDEPDPYDPDQPGIDDPDEGAKVYMQIDVVVRPWIVRQNNMILGH
jgi:hypothetical protein